jgi:protein ImuB
MDRRYISIFFHHLVTDWFTIQRPSLKEMPFVLAAPDHGRMVISAANNLAEAQGIKTGMVVADARIILPSLQVLDNVPGVDEKLLNRLADWCIRFAPYVAVDLPLGLILDATGCSHLWGGDEPYLKEIITRLNARGYQVRAAMADTMGTAWAIARYGKDHPIIARKAQASAISDLPAAALRIELELVDRLYKLGLRDIKDIISIPRSALSRRFGKNLVRRIEQALGYEEELIRPVQEIVPYQERLPCLEPIITLTGIEIALQRLLQAICNRLAAEGKGLRGAILKCYRVDGQVEKLQIGTNRPTSNEKHLQKLFENKLPSIEPASGIELFVLEALKVEDHQPAQKNIWEKTGGLLDPALSELLDRITGKFGDNCIRRFLPDEHYWPERSFKPAASLEENPTTQWRIDLRRPVHLLPKPELIEVTAPIPDYPPMLFRYKGQLHKITRADGPERIEQEWWLQQGKHRDYYCVEDEQGSRYWIFRAGHYDTAKSYRWYIHGFFA